MYRILGNVRLALQSACRVIRPQPACMFLQAMPAYGLYARHVDGLVLENADFATDTRKDVVLEDATCTSKDIK